jgi:hypothetical protein
MENNMEVINPCFGVLSLSMMKGTRMGIQIPRQLKLAIKPRMNEVPIIPQSMKSD